MSDNLQMIQKFVWSACEVVGFSLVWACDVIAADRDARPDPGSAKQSTAIIHGVIRGDDDGPLVGVRVRVSVPASDMRFVNEDPKVRVLETKTVRNGEYRFEIPGLSEPTKISIDAMKPGYRRISGTLMRGGEEAEFEITATGTAEKSFKLNRALYFSGVVVDENGNPIPNAVVGANANTGQASGGVERTSTNSDGLFELFNYPIERDKIGGVDCVGAVEVFHKDFLSHTSDDVYSIPENERRRMQIVLRSGYRISGNVLDAKGKPASAVMVKVYGDQQKAVMTDQEGKFELKGLAGGKSTLSVRALEIEQKKQLSLDLENDQTGLRIQLEQIHVPKDGKIYNVLGMQLTDETHEIQDAFSLPFPGGALILDPGRDPVHLQIGKLEKGFSFWCVGDTDVRNVKDFVSQILKEVEGQVEGQYSVRVVYNLSTIEFDGTNTQYLKLTKDDVVQLKAVLTEMEKK